jgi:DNA-binding transcriptional LysR family regulator
MMDRFLDLDAVQAFLHIADFGSFTRAAEALDTTQAAISLRLKRLEERLGNRLIERTPRRVELSAAGAAFLKPARDLTEAHERALAALSEPVKRFSLGISEHVSGPELPALIARMNAKDPRLFIEIRIAASRDLLAGFDRREFDAVIVRSDEGRRDGEFIIEDSFGWFAAAFWQHPKGEPIRLATLAEPCGVREIAVAALDEANIPWQEVFVGGGVAAVIAAASAGLGVAALAKRIARHALVDVGDRFGLPPLPPSRVMLHSRANDARTGPALKELAAAFRAVSHA